MTTIDYPLGTIVEVPVGRGVIRFSGPTQFKAGKWVGIELYEPNGKNNGSVDGVQYFTCPKNYGVFYRASQIKRALGNERVQQQQQKAHQRTASTSSLRKASPSPAKPSSQSPVPPPTAKKISLQRRTSLKPSEPEPSPPPPPAPRVSSPLAAPNTPPPSSFPSPTPAKPPSRPPSSLANNNSKTDEYELEIKELSTKVRVLESKRALDARTIRELEARIAESQSFIAIRPKLQAKLQSQQTELAATKRELADAQQLAELAEMRVLDAQEQLEVALLDKEVAEEAMELAKSELDEFKEKTAELEVELDVLRSEIELDAEEGGEEGVAKQKNIQDSLAYIQLEKQNERLKEALLRLRDMTQENDIEQRKRIAEMEKDMSGVDDLQSQYSSVMIKLSNAEVQIEDLKLQLDDALGAEEMLVQLTERNLELGEKIEEMRITIEDLEALKELNDELEETHIETEKQLNEDLEVKEMQIQEHVRKIETLEEVCLDFESTIEQFRDLVLRLQNELADLRAQTQTAQTESATAASQTAAMMSLNLKLQSSASKNQTRQVEYEIAKFEAKEARELIGIVQPYLPQMYVENDMVATSCYLFFQRLGNKVEIINRIVGEIHGLPKSLNGSITDVMVGVTEMRSNLAALATLCRRFAAILRRCDVDSFLNIGRLYPEIAPMERRIDMHIDLLKRSEFREAECVADVIKIQNQFEHLAETYFDSFDHDLGERELGYVISFDSDLDIFAAAVGVSKTSVEKAIQDSEVVLDMGGMDIQPELLSPLQSLLDQCKSAKSLSRKLTKRLEDLTQDSSALKAHLIPQMKTLSEAAQGAVNFAITLAQQIIPHIANAQSGKSSFQLNTVLSFVKQVASSTVGGGSWDAVRQSIASFTAEGSALLPRIMEGENIQKVAGVSPWVTRINEIKASTAVNIEAERKLAQLNEELQSLARTLKVKDQTIQESGVKIELIERKLESSKKLADANVDLQSEISKLRKEKVSYDEAMEQMQTDLDAVEQENAKLKTLTAGLEKQPSTQPEPETVAIEGSLETSYLLEQIDALRGTVRFLRTENSYLKGHDLLREIEALPLIPEPVTRPPTPPLDPSGASDSEDSDEDRPKTPPTLRSLATETKLLYRDVIKFSSSPRVVDLTALERPAGRVWMPRKKMPGQQVLDRKMEAERLGKRVKGLMDRASAVGAI